MTDVLYCANVSNYHPLFLYECIWNLMNMGLLLYLGKRLVNWLKNGDLFLIYLMVYGVGRFMLEFVRLDSSQVAGINANQTLMAVVALVSAGLFLWRHSNYRGILKKKTKVEKAVVKTIKTKTTKPTQVEKKTKGVKTTKSKASTTKSKNSAEKKDKA